MPSFGGVALAVQSHGLALELPRSYMSAAKIGRWQGCLVLLAPSPHQGRNIHLFKATVQTPTSCMSTAQGWASLESQPTFLWEWVKRTVIISDYRVQDFSFGVGDLIT